MSSPIDPTVITEELSIKGEDRSHRVISNIYWSTRKFAIYQADGEVRYALPDDYDTAAKLRSNVFGLIEVRSNLERLRRGSGVSAGDSERAASEIAGALALAFETDPASDAAKVPLLMLQRTEARLLSLIKSQYRKRYMVGAIGAFLLVILVLVILMAVFDTQTPPRGQIHLDAVGRYAGYCIFGAFGALFSVASRIDSLDFRMDIGLWEYFVAGLTRVGIGVIAGIVVGLALNSKFIVLNFGSQNGSVADVVYYLIAFIAGFSESLVPNILARGEEVSMSSAAQAQETPQKPAGS